MRTHFRVAVGLLVSGVLAISAFPAAAQEPSYATPPPLSPWLSLYRHDAGPMDPYHSFVRPELELRESMRKQDARIHSLGEEVTRYEETGGVPPTGSGSVFMSYSHFYPGLGTPNSGPFAPSIYPVSPPRREIGAKAAGLPATSYRLSRSPVAF